MRLLEQYWVVIKDIILWGATGHSKVLREFLTGIGYRLTALFDSNPEVPPPFPDLPLFHGKEGFHKWLEQNKPITGAVAIGGSRGAVRLGIQRFFKANHVSSATLVHPSAYVAANALLGAGSQVLAQATVCAEAVLGEACIVNTGASVDHESVLGDGVHIAPGAVVTGCVRIGDFSMVSAGAVVLPRVQIGRNSIVGAGSVVTRDIADNSIAYGNPAKIIRVNPDPELFI